MWNDLTILLFSATVYFIVILNINAAQHHHERQSKLRDPSVAHNEEHLKLHMQSDQNIDELNKEEMEFRLFTMHDTDNNTKLDGLELLAALTHHHELATSEFGDGKIISEEKYEEFVAYVDDILEIDDHNRDGYVTYAELKQHQ